MPRARGRHSQGDAGGDAGRPAADLLAAWGAPGLSSLQVADATGGTTVPRRRRRYAPDTDATGVQVLPRSAVEMADVEITGLDAAGIADVGLTAAGLDLSAFGIDRPRGPRTGRRVTPAAAQPAWSWTAADAALDAAPRTTEMLAVPPALPHLGEDDRGPARPRLGAPAPRPATDPTTADRVVADRFADAETDPGWRSGSGRPAPAVRRTDGQPQATVLGSLAALFDESPAAALPRPAAPIDEPATEVQPAFATSGVRSGAESWTPVSARHRGGVPEDGEDAYPSDHPYDDDLSAPSTVSDHTGGLEVIAAGRSRSDDGTGEFDLIDEHDDDRRGGSGGGGRGGRGRGRGGSGRKRRGPIALVLTLLVLAALVAGIVLGGKTLWDTINPMAEDYSGGGTGSVQVQVEQGDSLRTIAGTLVDADVIASTKPFQDAAKANPQSTGIQPGVYSMRLQMSGQAALDLLLEPATRMVTKVTVPEGQTVVQVLQRLADDGGLPLADLQAAAADPAAIGLPAYANGMLEGFLFPATYDITPDQTAADVLRDMVSGTDQMLTDLGVPVDQRLTVITKASIVQAEAGSVEDMGMVARVLENRLADGMALQLDTTVNYANGKAGITTTAEDRANPSPYNTYVHTGLPPGAISNPGADAVRAVLAPTPGDWRFFVVVDPDTGETRFAATAAEHQQNVLLFQQWLQDNPGN